MEGFRFFSVLVMTIASVAALASVAPGNEPPALACYEKAMALGLLSDEQASSLCQGGSEASVQCFEDAIAWPNPGLDIKTALTLCRQACNDDPLNCYLDAIAWPNPGLNPTHALALCAPPEI